MFVRGMLTASILAALLCASVNHALAQANPKAAAKSAPTKPEVAAAGGAEPALIGQYGIWGAYMATPNGKKVCFALAKPSSSKTNPPNRPRDPAYAFISTRPAEKVVNEVSIMIGYVLKPGSESTIEVGGVSPRPRRDHQGRPGRRRRPARPCRGRHPCHGACRDPAGPACPARAARRPSCAARASGPA
jgi:hypothetical protein